MSEHLLSHYWKQLGCEPTSDNLILLRSWNSLAPEYQTSDLRLFVKANLDSYYHTFLKHYPSLSQLYPAGFFDDGHPIGEFEYHVDFFTTPLHKILRHIEQLSENELQEKPLIVLLNTGSYSPLHIGHLSMMEEAKKSVSEKYHVIGGYFSPSHDKYVSQKYQGTAHYQAESRIALCEEVVADSEWLMIDPWEARYNSTSINFTDVIIRLKQYFAKHIQYPIKIGYVFGSDNAGFSWCFVEDDVAICFERPGYHLQFEQVKKDPLLQQGRHFFIPHQNNAYSSKEIREGKSEFLPEKIKRLYYLYKEAHYPIQTPIYLIRDDRSFAISQFPEEVKGDNFNRSLEQFYQGLKETIKVAFRPYCHMQVLSLSLEQQNQYLNLIEGNVINLDFCTYHPHQYHVGISRLFALSDGQVFAPQLIHRPGTPSIEEQIKNIPPGNYKLVDDDIASGRTISLIRELLPESIHIDEYIAFSRQSFYDFFDYELSYQFHDIVDLRDFLIGAKGGGLVVELPNKEVARVPYVWPYVSLSHRAKIPHVSQFEFSLSIWKINHTFFSSLSIPLKIKDMSPDFQQLTHFLGLDEKMTMVDFCQYHLDKLEDLHP